MMILAHILGIPVEETLVPLVSSIGAGTVLWLVGTMEHQWKTRRARSYRK
jgi:hypothetical protein